MFVLHDDVGYVQAYTEQRKFLRKTATFFQRIILRFEVFLLTLHIVKRKVGRVTECAGLEIRYTLYRVSGV